MFRGIHVRVLNQTDNFISFVLTSSNSKRRMKRTEFDDKVKQGIYEVQNPQTKVLA